MGIAIPIGLAFGVLAVYIISIIFKMLATGFNLDVVVSPIVILGSAFLGVVSVYVSALLPAKTVSKISPLVAISSNHLINKENIKKKRKSKFIKSLGIDKVMALKNIKRNKKRFYITAISMAISVVLFISFMSFTKYVMDFTDKVSPQQESSFEIRENIEVLKYEGLSDDLIKDLNKISDIEEVMLNYQPLKLKAVVDESIIPQIIKEQNYDFIKEVKLNGENKKYLSVYMNAFDNNKINSLNKYIRDGSIEDIKENEVIVVRNQNMPGGIYSPVMDLKVGDEVTVDSNYFYFQEELTIQDYKDGKTPQVKENPKSEYTNGDLITLKVKAIIEDEPYSSMGEPGIQKLILPTENLKNIIKDNEEYVKKLGIKSAYLKINNEKIETVEKSLTKLIEEYPSYEASNMVELQRQFKGIATQVMILLIGFVVVIALISSINVINTVTTNIIIRKRELSGLKAIGMTSKELKNMISLEGSLFGVYGGTIGSIIGVGLSYLIYLRFSSIKNFSYEIPWLSIVIAIGGVMIIGYLSSLIAMRRLSKENIIEGIKQE